MKYLYLDASDMNETVLQAANEKQIFHESFKTERDLASKLPSLIDFILEKAELSKKDLDCLAICAGPGSLTGLRVAMSFFRLVAFAGSYKLVSLNLFELIRESMRLKGEKGEVSIILPTLINSAFAITCNLEEDEKLQQPRLIQLSEAKDLLGKKVGMACAADIAEEICIAPEAIDTIIKKKYETAASDFKDILKVLPMYIIPSQAERKLEAIK
ncbi:MAG: tRNA (adenosine(37)-N6)-threonylcarbamoyltransferase complex dimerization subunit type 1 TsaB [Candidatus Riflebacteria bacterium]|nr:tRNA (adenosine(37)-N6)-threonylcarbamoyltransferase complex dimerization subunit type 1 TsaB [Candidatus Riflebacteria bacterium]